MKIADKIVGLSLGPVFKTMIYFFPCIWQASTKMWVIPISIAFLSRYLQNDQEIFSARQVKQQRGLATNTYSCFSHDTCFFQADASLSVNVTSFTLLGESFERRYLKKNKTSKAIVRSTIICFSARKIQIWARQVDHISYKLTKIVLHADLLFVTITDAGNKSFDKMRPANITWFA